jgi:AAA ATPase domain
MSPEEILVSVIVGFLVNEACDVSPWCAHYLVRWSVRLRYANPERRRIRGDELVALIDERPGKLLKLGTGLGFLVAALPVWLRHVAPALFRALAQRWSPEGQALQPTESAQLALPISPKHAKRHLRSAISFPPGGRWGGLVTVIGQWGSGKTTLVSNALEAIGRPRIVRYNAWMMSASDTGKHAMDELPKEIRASNRLLTGVARAFERYLRTVPPGAESRSPAPDELEARRRLARKLRRLSRPMVVAVDDIDRIRPEEAAQVFELVARTDGLPQLRYLMSFDRSSMEQVLPPGLLDRCTSKLEVDLGWGTLRQRPI